MERVLLVVSSCARMTPPAGQSAQAAGESAGPADGSGSQPGAVTGAWMEELAASYYAFADAGCEVLIASPRGGEGPIDPLSLQLPWLTDTGRRFQADAQAREKLSDTISLAEVRAADFDALYLVGGAAAAWDFPCDDHLARVIQDLASAHRPVAAVCHGVLGLTKARDTQGNAIVANRAVTGISNAEEIMTGFDKLVPLLPEERLKELGARYSCAEPFAAKVVSDGNLFTGQNPASAAPLALAVIASLRNGRSA
ncbi:MAG TPA: type 1 glutamine amidotransferase domain-containing protein [Steroidobacteraceae bacterium]|nr:type 1 glutamine amidotransferase domain-containing protein [Steroidobacteraceae bacterium]